MKVYDKQNPSTLKAFIFNTLNSLDFYSQPLSLINNGQRLLRSPFGGIVSIITIIFFVLIAFVYMVNPKVEEICPMTKINAMSPDSIEIDTKNKLFIFFAIRDNVKVTIFY